MKDKDLKSRLKSLGLRRPSSSYVDKVLAQKPEAVETEIRRPWSGRRIWIYGPIAAVILVFVMVGVLHFLPSGELEPGGVVKNEEVEIPAALAQMSLEELLELHFGKAETSFDSKTVAAAVEVALDNVSPRGVLDIGTKYSGQRGMSASRMPYYPPAVSKIVKGSDFVIRARVETVTLDVDDLKAAIVKKRLNRHWFEHHGAMIKAEVQLHVFEGYPSLAPVDGEKLSLWPVLSTEKLDAFKAGEEYLIALQQDGDIIWMLPYTEGLYTVDGNSGMLSGFRGGPMLLDEAWQFIMDMYDAIHKDIEPSGEILDYWLAKLQSEDLMECWTAVEYFNALAAPPVAAELVMGAFEQHYDAIVEQRRGREDKSLDFEPATLLKDALDLLWRVGDESTVNKMLALYEKDRASGGSILNADESKVGMHAQGFTERIVRLTLKNPSPERRERLLQLFPKPGESVIGELGKTEGEDIDQLLLEMLKNPASFGISHAHHLLAVWSALAHRGNAEIGPYLRRFISDPQNTDLGVNKDDPREAVSFAYHAFKLLPQETASHKEFLRTVVDYYYNTEDDSGSSLNLVVNTMDDFLEPGDMEFNGFLQETVTSHWKVPILIAERVPDPCFVPVIRQALEKEVTGTLIAALFACGEEEEAIEMAVTELDKLFDEENGQMLGGRLYKLFPVIRFLGTTGDESILPVIENFTREDVIDTLRETDARFGGRYAFIIDKLQQDAVLAFAKLGGESVIPRLKELYESEDIYIQLLAAVSLYALGDDTGYELLEYFVNRTERSIPEIEMRWHVDMYGGRPFEDAVRYLKSARTDALLEKREHRASEQRE